MTRNDLIVEALKAANSEGKRDMSLADMNAAYEGICGVMAAELLCGGEVPLGRLGKLKMTERAARKGRNPRNGELIEIPACRKPVFVAWKELKEALKG